MTEYSFIDIETPNRLNNRICSIGIEKTDDRGEVLFSKHYYVNPEQDFDNYAMRVHGITPSQVVNEPTFLEHWNNEISSIISNSTLVAHNASFDLNVLGKTLDSYLIDKPKIRFVDTVDMARHYLNLENYQLPTLCSYFGIELADHHNALSDAAACRRVFWSILKRVKLKPSLGTYWFWKEYDPSSYKAGNCDQSLTDLYGVILGINADKIIHFEERNGLLDWMDRNKQNRQTKYMKEVYDTLEHILKKNVVSSDELNKLLSLLRPFVLNGHNKAETVKMQALIGALRGISCDGRINSLEGQVLSEWLDDIQIENDTLVYSLRNKLQEALEDGEIDAREEDDLLELCSKLIDPIERDSAKEDPVVVEFEGNRFVLSGNFTNGSKADIEGYIRDRGGEVVGSVSGKVAYVVVGGQGSEAFSCGKYGTKVKKAMSLQDQGKPIAIIEESMLFNQEKTCS